MTFSQKLVLLLSDFWRIPSQIAKLKCQFRKICLIKKLQKSSFNHFGYRGLDAVSQIGVVRTRMIWVRGWEGLLTSDQLS